MDMVRCRADHAYPGRPLEVFRDGKWHRVLSILREAHTPTGKTYQVACGVEGELWVAFDQVKDSWTVSMVELP